LLPGLGPETLHLRARARRRAHQSADDARGHVAHDLELEPGELRPRLRGAHQRDRRARAQPEPPRSAAREPPARRRALRAPAAGARRRPAQSRVLRPGAPRSAAARSGSTSSCGSTRCSPAAASTAT
jgi:hypothetical protein